MSSENEAGAWFTAAARVRRRSHQYRATPEQWEHLKNGAQLERPYNSALCLLELRARVEALEAAQQDKLDRLIALDREDPTPDPAMTEPHPASAEMRPAGGLVERVRRAIGDDAPCSHSNARAAIREVAAAARETGCASAQGLINWLEQEANRG